jgi:hypothetical protein
VAVNVPVPSSEPTDTGAVTSVKSNPLDQAVVAAFVCPLDGWK